MADRVRLWPHDCEGKAVDLVSVLGKGADFADANRRRAHTHSKMKGGLSVPTNATPILTYIYIHQLEPLAECKHTNTHTEAIRTSYTSELDLARGGFTHATAKTHARTHTPTQPRTH